MTILSSEHGKSRQVNRKDIHNFSLDRECGMRQVREQQGRRHAPVCQRARWTGAPALRRRPVRRHLEHRSYQHLYRRLYRHRQGRRPSPCRPPSGSPRRCPPAAAAPCRQPPPPPPAPPPPRSRFLCTPGQAANPPSAFTLVTLGTRQHSHHKVERHSGRLSDNPCLRR